MIAPPSLRPLCAALCADSARPARPTVHCTAPISAALPTMLRQARAVARARRPVKEKVSRDAERRAALVRSVQWLLIRHSASHSFRCHCHCALGLLERLFLDQTFRPLAFVFALGLIGSANVAAWWSLHKSILELNKTMIEHSTQMIKAMNEHNTQMTKTMNDQNAEMTKTINELNAEMTKAKTSRTRRSTRR